MSSKRGSRNTQEKRHLCDATILQWSSVLRLESSHPFTYNTHTVSLSLSISLSLSPWETTQQSCRTLENFPTKFWRKAIKSRGWISSLQFRNSRWCDTRKQDGECHRPAWISTALGPHKFHTTRKKCGGDNNTPELSSLFSTKSVDVWKAKIVVKPAIYWLTFSGCDTHDREGLTRNRVGSKSKGEHQVFQTICLLWTTGVTTTKVTN